MVNIFTNTLGNWFDSATQRIVLSAQIEIGFDSDFDSLRTTLTEDISQRRATREQKKGDEWISETAKGVMSVIFCVR